MEESSEPLGPGVVKYRYQLSDKGKELAERVVSVLDSKMITKIETSAVELGELSTSELVSMSKRVFS